MLARFGVLAGAFALLTGAGPGPSVASPTVVSLLERYKSAMDDKGVPDLGRFVVTGSIAGEGLTGTFQSFRDGNRERDEQTLGPRTQTVLMLGEKIYVRDADGVVREMHGVLLRRARTEQFIDSGLFAQQPQHCVFRGTTRRGERVLDLLDVTAPGGQTETLELDDQTGLPARIAYDDDDGRTTIDLADWHTIAGHRVAFRSVSSNGDHAFDVTQVTTNVQPQSSLPAGTFDIPRSRRIDMAAPQTISLTVQDSHLYVPVTIAGQTYRFLLDSGAGNVLLDTRVARAAGLIEEGTLEASGASRTGGLHVAKLPELAVGNGKLHDLVVATVDLGGSTAGTFRIDGILGSPFFAQAVVKLDYANLAMTFGAPGTMQPTGSAMPLELDRELPEVTLRLNNSVDGEFVVDTGNSAEVLLYRPFVDRNPGVVPFSTTQHNSYGLGGEPRRTEPRLDELNVAGIPMYHQDVDVMLATRGAFADRFSSGNIGLGLLKNFVLTFDEPNERIYVDKGSAFDDGRYRYR